MPESARPGGIAGGLIIGDSCVKEPVIVYPDAPEQFEATLEEGQRARLRAIGKFSFFEGPTNDVEEFLGRVADAHAIILGWGLPVDVIERASHLELISFTGIGVGNFVDLDLARARNITVTNTPGYADVTVAEHTLGLMLDLARNVSRLDRDTRAGGWSKALPGVTLRGLTLGLVGFGGIAQQVARFGRALGMNVLVWTRRPELYRADTGDVEFVALEALLEDSDVVSVHVAHTPDTEQLLDADRLARLKPEAMLVNTARGEIIDETALVNLLRARRIRGAALDVFTQEPLAADHPFLGLDNVVLTPHTAYNTPEASANILDIAIDNVHAYFAGEPRNVVT